MITRDVDKSLRVLVESLGGLGNPRYNKALCMALVSAPVREAVEAAIDTYINLPPGEWVSQRLVLEDILN